MAYIYKITNRVNEKSYIGKTEKSNPSDRFREHLSECRRTRSEKRPLYAAMRKYGEENFSFQILEETNTPNEREIELIKKHNTYGSAGYNATLGGDGKCYIDHDKIVELYKAGGSMKKVASEMGICVDTVKNVLESNHIEKRDGTELLGRAVLQLDKDTGDIIAEFRSIGEAARAFGNDAYNSNISRVCSGKRKTTLGYKWRYKQ